ncbi:GAF domain-containing protein [Dactylosporangium aurantiacum]|uniref:Sensor-like histidine kinase SenX3 n=1 Tax=Dactylosporangium aurantiacum TaxID=35754 RepID=A0A9Q9MLB6_9ACTN|nr:ATP-binding protein [Dactylosporangium aurantiacum]MDG6102059.1 ATP-binding protein [Dactylosporangium aurantiacum]UWZ53607.1 GAF domain-containing protein [Dactylosporangium aurantiacum]
MTSTTTRAYPVPTDEQERLRSLADYGVIGAPPLPDLPSVVELAAYVCGVPNAVVNLISATQQHQLAAYGFEAGVCDRGDSMCAVSIVEAETVVVRDATLDPRFARNPFVTGEIDDVRFYASAHLRDRDGHVLGTLCVFDQRPHDLTPQQREGLDKLARMVMDVMDLHRHGQLLQEALDKVRRTTVELQRSNASLQHFAGQVSHDLKNPLTGVLGFVAMLAEIDTVVADPTAKRCIDRALSSATRMWRMIEDVLSHAALGGRPSFAPVDLGSLTQQVVDDVSAAISAARATVDVGPLPVAHGDATQLRVLIQNLLSNALKFRRRDRDCRITVTGEETPDGWTIAVADNGIGIPAEDRPRVLEMFTRLRADVEGSGIGLATCQRIVEAHGATLVIDETPGGGTTVRVTLPRP